MLLLWSTVFYNCHLGQLASQCYSRLSDTCCNSAHLFHRVLREMQKSSATIVSFSVLVVLTTFALSNLQFFHEFYKHLELPGLLEFRVVLLCSDLAFVSAGIPLSEVIYKNRNIDFLLLVKWISIFLLFLDHSCIISVDSYEQHIAEYCFYLFILSP